MKLPTRPLRHFLFASFFTCVLLLNTSKAEAEKKPARVNPVFPSTVRETLDLDTWRFKTDSKDEGKEGQWFKKSVAFDRDIKVPGGWQEQGVGMEQKVKKGGIDFPEYVGFRHHYVGAAWYKKTLEIPKNWNGKKIWLEIGGVHPQGEFWLNDNYLGSQKIYFEAFKYDITDLVKAGEECTITMRVDNREQVSIGGFDYMHNWGGVQRKVVLTASNPVTILTTKIVPDLDKGVLKITGELDSEATGHKIAVAANIIGDEKSSGSGSAEITGKTFSLEVPVNSVIAWSPDSPRLYKISVNLMKDNTLVDDWIDRVGFCKREIRGNDIFINNKQVFIRGYGHDSVFPETVTPPSKREDYLWRLKRAREFGFTYARHHTMVPMQEYFDAADEVGIMVQPEAARARNIGVKPQMEVIHGQYHNHPSLATYSMGNEAGHTGRGEQKLAALKEVSIYMKQLDPTRFVLDTDGDKPEQLRDNTDFMTYKLKWRDENKAASDKAFQLKPVLHHEFTNVPLVPDPSTADTKGIYRPLKMEEFRDWANASPYKKEILAAVSASHELQKLFHKRKISDVRSYPELDGYSFWSICDYWEIGQGLLDLFWRERKWGKEEFLQYNNDLVIIATLPKETYTAGETFNVPLKISNYRTDMENVAVEWDLWNGKEKIAQGKQDGIKAPVGVTDAGFKITLPELDKHARLVLHARLSGNGNTAKNDWSVYAFSKKDYANKFPMAVLIQDEGVLDNAKMMYPGLELNKEGGLVVSGALTPEDVKHVEAGGRMIVTSLLGLPIAKGQMIPGWWKTIRGGGQPGVALASHPALANFPHTPSAELQLKSMFGGMAEMDGVTFPFTSIIHGLGHPAYEKVALRSGMFEVALGKGMLLVTNLNLTNDTPEARAMLDSLLRYGTSPAFLAGDRKSVSGTDFLTNLNKIHASIPKKVKGAGKKKKQAAEEEEE